MVDLMRRFWRKKAITGLEELETLGREVEGLIDFSGELSTELQKTGSVFAWFASVDIAGAVLEHAAQLVPLKVQKINIDREHPVEMEIIL